MLFRVVYWLAGEQAGRVVGSCRLQLGGTR